MDFNPLGDRVVVRPLVAAEVSKGGILIPELAQERPQEGEVVAVGPGPRNKEGQNIPMGIEVGDKIMYGKYNGVEIKVGGEKFIIMKESDVFGILRNE